MRTTKEIGINIRRGEIWTGTFSADTLQKTRPLLIVSNDDVNSNDKLLDVIVVKIVSMIKPDGKIVITNPEEDILIKLKKESIIQCGKISVIEKRDLVRMVTQITSAELRQVDRCLKNALALS